jgi:predicted DsbA family dithiol-disulfide isomerase
MDKAAAKAMLDSDTYAEEVRAKENFYTSAGIHSVPAVIINDKHLISGGQPAACLQAHCARLLQKLPEPIKALHGFRAVKIFSFYLQ